MKQSVLLLLIQLSLVHFTFSQTAGGLDASFSTTGKTTTSFTGNINEKATASAIQADGKIVVVGSNASGHVCIARYLKNGTLDITFSGDGKVTTIISNSDVQIYGMVIDNSGKIVIVGNIHDSGDPALYTDFLVLRYLSNGTLDTSFDSDGILRNSQSLIDFYNDVKITPAGKIIAVGSQNSAVVIRQYNSNGTLDTSFGTAGTTLGGIQGAAKSIQIQTDGKIVIGGNNIVTVTPVSENDFFVIRLNANGSFDTTFDSDGKAFTDIGASTDDHGTALAVQEDGKIVLVGRTWTGSNYKVALVRYKVDGSLDTNFSSDGKQTTSVAAGNDVANSIAIQPNGNIVVGGTSHTEQFTYIDLNNVHHIVGENDDFLILQYTIYGNLDTEFSSDGKVKIAFGEGLNDEGNGLLLQNDGKIVLVGSASNGTNNDFAICRLHGIIGFKTLENRLYTSFSNGFEESYAMAFQPDEKIIIAGYTLINSVANWAIARYDRFGKLDNSFSNDGKLVISNSILQGAAFAKAIAIQSDGKILVAGQTFNGTDSDYAIIRLLANGSFDPNFGTNGVVLVNVFGSDYCQDMKIQPDGKIVMAGFSISGAPGIYKPTVVRLNTTGNLDTSFDTDGKVELSGDIYSNEVNSLQLHDGKLILSGNVYPDNIIAYRLNPNGSIDNTFDGDGKVIYDVANYNAFSQASAIQSDGKLLLGIYKTNESTVSKEIIRYNLDGSLDNTFLSNPIFSIGEITSIKIMPNGKIICGVASNQLIGFNNDGSYDFTFGENNPIANLPKMGYPNNIQITAIVPGNYDRIYYTGYYHNGTTSDFILGVFLQCKQPFLSLTAYDNLSTPLTTPYTAQKIEAKNLISSPGVVEYRAEKSILLLPNFKVESGAVFKASIHDFCFYSFNPEDFIVTSPY